MHRTALLLATLLAAQGPAARAIEFHLKELSVVAGEGESSDLYFPHEQSRIFYRPPAGWRLEQSAARFTARAPSPQSGTLTLETIAPVARLAPPGTNTPEALAAYAEFALAGFNAQAQQPKVLECVAEKMGGRALPCTRLTIEYADQVLRRRMTLCYVQFRPNLVLLVRIDSLKQDAAVHGTALHSLEAFTEMPAT